MKKTTPRKIALDLKKVGRKLEKARAEFESTRSYLEYLTAGHANLPAQRDEAWNELQAAESAATEALADLTKPLDRYHYEQNWQQSRRENGYRRYSSPAAQKAFDAERAESFARARYEAAKVEAVRSLEDYTAEARAAHEYAESDYSALTAQHDNLVRLAGTILGREVTAPELIALFPATETAPQEAPNMIELPARAINDGFIVLAENLSGKLGKVKQVTVNGIVYLASHIREWARLESGQLTVTPHGATLSIVSDTSRMTVKGGKPVIGSAPALVFVTA